MTLIGHRVVPIQHIELSVHLAISSSFVLEKNASISTEYGSTLTFRRRIKSRLPFAGIIRRLPYSTRFQDKG